MLAGIPCNQGGPVSKTGRYQPHPLWVEAMAAVIKRQKWFRWHDAGDVSISGEAYGKNYRSMQAHT